MKRRLILGCLVSLCIGVSSLSAAQNIIIDENSFEILNKALKKLIIENKALKKEIAEVRQYCKNTKEELLDTNKVNTEVKEDKKYITTSWKLNLRDKPTHENSQILKAVDIGYILELDSPEVFNNDWVKTKDGFYLNKKYIKELEKIELITDELAVIRSKPISSEKSFIKEIPKGVSLIAVGEIKNWYILDDGSFIYKGYVSKI
jgi:hypothetical protein